MIEARRMEQIEVILYQSVDVHHAHHNCRKRGKIHDTPHEAIHVSQRLKDFSSVFFVFLCDALSHIYVVRKYVQTQFF